MIENINSKNKSSRYGLAAPGIRIFTRICDFIIVLLVSFGCASAIFLTDPNFKGEFNFIISEPWRYFCFSIIATSLFFIYFIIQPYFWKGKTLCMKLFKLAIYNQLLTHWLFNLIKHEMFIWIIYSFISFAFSLILCVVGYTKSAKISYQIITSLFSITKNDNEYYIYKIFFLTMNGVMIILIISIIISIIVHPKRQAWHDKFSNIVIVKTVDIIGDKDKNNNLNSKLKTPKRNYSLPGGILSNPNDEINQI